MMMDWFANIALDLQTSKRDFVLVTVLSKKGSSPSVAGSKMIVFKDGTSIGTVGGGMLEATAQKHATEMFASKTTKLFSFNLSGKDAANMQMMCGGIVELLVDYIPATEMNLAMFSKLQMALKEKQKCFFVTILSTQKHPAKHCVLLNCGDTLGEVVFNDDVKTELISKAKNSAYPVSNVINNQHAIVERCFIPSTLYIVGAGHVSEHLAKLAEMSNFQTVIMDDREEFANAKRFPNAETISVLTSFENCFNSEQIDEGSFIVIVTRGHIHDRIVLKQALETPAGYIGMLGSKNKRNKIYDALTKEGVSAEQLNRVYSPIGLSIKAKTLGEIAVSIMAELIQVRATKILEKDKIETKKQYLQTG